ncbi:MAG: hypothetical protein AB1553_06105 [Nitrospirota bacterium]
MSEQEKYTEYLKEKVNEKYVCVYCRKTEEEIGGRLEGHAGWCKWRRDTEEMEKTKGQAERAKESFSSLKDRVKRYER